MRQGILEASGVDIAEHKTAEDLFQAIRAKHPNKTYGPEINPWQDD
ncbi:MAG: hypothetical protein U0Z26_01000 [Anaerolineales bacterium]